MSIRFFINRLKFLSLLVWFCSLSFVAWGLGSDQYQVRLSTSLTSQLVFDEDVKRFRDSLKRFHLRSNVDLSTPTANVSCDVLLEGVLISSWGPIDLQLLGHINKGVISIPKTLDQFYVLLSDWAHFYAAPNSLGKLTPNLQSCFFTDGEGFSLKYDVKSLAQYTLLLDVPLLANSLSVPDRTKEISVLLQHIKKAEADNRAKVIIGNNTSGRSIFVFLNKNGVVELRHPFHAVIYAPGKKYSSYEYSDPLSKVADLWEIKKLLKSKELKDFVGVDFSRVRVKMKFFDKKNYTGEWYSDVSMKTKIIAVTKGKLIISSQ